MSQPHPKVESQKNHRIIGITGGSGSGKTALVQTVSAILPNSVTLLPLDRYYQDLSQLSWEERAHKNFDHPDSLEMEMYAQHLRCLAAGECIQAPEYDFSTHTRTDTRTVPPADVIFAEGTLILSHPEITSLIDLAVFVDTPSDLRLLRRIQRDIQERGRTLDSIIQQYLQTVRPMYEQFVAPVKNRADIVLDGTKPVKDLAEELAAFILQGRPSE